MAKKPADKQTAQAQPPKDTRQPYEPPHIKVIGTFDELTKVKSNTSTDGHGHKSV